MGEIGSRRSSPDILSAPAPAKIQFVKPRLLCSGVLDQVHSGLGLLHENSTTPTTHDNGASMKTLLGAGLGCTLALSALTLMAAEPKITFKKTQLDSEFRS